MSSQVIAARESQIPESIEEPVPTGQPSELVKTQFTKIMTPQERQVFFSTIIDRLRSDANNAVSHISAELDQLRKEDEILYWVADSTVKGWALLNDKRVINGRGVSKAVREKINKLAKIKGWRSAVIRFIAPELVTDLSEINQDYEEIMAVIEDEKLNLKTLKAQQSLTAAESKETIFNAQQEASRIIEQVRTEEKEIRSDIKKLEILKEQILQSDPQLEKLFRLIKEEEAPEELKTFSGNPYNINIEIDRWYAEKSGSIKVTKVVNVASGDSSYVTVMMFYRKKYTFDVNLEHKDSEVLT